MDYIYAIAIIVSVLGVMIGIQYIKSKGYIKPEQIEQAIDALTVAERLINMLNQKDKVKTNVNMVLDIADKVADYVHKLMGSASVEERAALAKEVTTLLFKKIGAKLSHSENQLVEIVIDKSLEYWNYNQ